MVQKRPSRDQEEGDGDTTNPHRDSRKRPHLRTVVEELTRVPGFKAEFEQFFRRVVRKELEPKLYQFFNASSSHSSHRPAGPVRGESDLQLRFVGQIPSTLFTSSRIQPVRPGPESALLIILFDAVSERIVSSGPLSSIKVELVALDGEFGSDDNEYWTEEEFSNSVLREREGRRPLVAGDLTVTLSEGLGEIGNVEFTDNSSWIRSRKFRLGARKISGEVRIREARSGAFVVKDHRGESYRKHHPPFLNDEVWRLEKIAKEGAFHNRLSEHGITTVKDFLRLFIRDPSRLRGILRKISDRTWEGIVAHATNCVVDDNEFYALHSAEHGVTVVFNSIYKVVGARFDYHFLSPEQFNPSQKILVENLKRHAYVHESELVPVDWLSLASLAWSPADPTLDHQHRLQAGQQGQSAAQSGLNQSTTSSPTGLIGSEVRHQLAPIQPHIFFPETDSNSFSREDLFAIPSFPTNHSSSENIFHFQTSNVASPWSDQGTGFIFASSNDNDSAQAEIFPVIPQFVHMSPDTKGKARWRKIRAAFKWLALGLKGQAGLSI